MRWPALFRRREPATVAPDLVWPMMDTGKLAPVASAPAPVTCAEAGRGGYIVRQDRERAKIRDTTIKLAEYIGKPEKADPLR